MLLQRIRIISRNSQLALCQAQQVQQCLISYYPNLSVEIIGITTAGDRNLAESLAKIGGKGLFIKELEYQLLAQTADIAVHSLKDLPAKLAPEFTLAAVLTRENPADAFVSNLYATLSDMPRGSIIGTSSARRMAILKHYYPHLVIKLLRGNLQTRLAKLDQGDYGAIILAVAGLKRLGLSARIRQKLPLAQFVPAIGQGALAIEILSQRQELLQLLQPLADAATTQAIGAEREMGRFLNASCNLPIAGFAEFKHGQLHLNALIADNETADYFTASASGGAADYLNLGQECAQKLLAQGAANIVLKYS